MRTRLIGFALLIFIGLILDQCSSAKRNDSGEITKSGDLSAFEISVGDCFNELPNLDDTAQTFSSVSAVPCNQSHHWQAFHKGIVELSEYSESGVSEAAQSQCSSAERYLVNEMSAIKFDAFRNATMVLLYPTEKSWNLRSDRSIDCLIGSDTEEYFTSVLD